MGNDKFRDDLITFDNEEIINKNNLLSDYINYFLWGEDYKSKNPKNSLDSFEFEVTDKAKSEDYNKLLINSVLFNPIETQIRKFQSDGFGGNMKICHSPANIGTFEQKIQSKNKKCEEDEIKSIIGGTKPLKYKYIPGFPFVVEDKFDEFLKIIKDADPRDPGLFTINSIA